MNPDGSVELPRWAKAAAAIACFAVVAALLEPVARHVIFATWSPFDDEGYLLISLKGFISDGQLYDYVFSQYGPFFFELWGGIFSILGIDVTHDSGRTTTLAVWVLTSALTGIVAWRASGSLVIGLTVQLLSFRLLAVLRGEPMHPGGLICLIVVGLIAAALLVRQKRAPAPMLLIGALIAALVLTKVNVGGLAVASVVLVCFATYPALARHRRLRLCVEAAFILTPILLLGSDFSEGWARAFSLHVAIAALAVTIALRALPPDPRRANQELQWLGAGFVATAALICVIAVALGTSPAGLADGVIFTPIGQPGAFVIPHRLPGWALPADFLLLGLCVGYRTLLARGLTNSPAWALARATAGAAGAILIALTASNIGFPANGAERSTFELSALGVAWIALFTGPLWDPPRVFAVRLIPALAVLQALHAYPVAGSQINFAALPLLFVAAICAAGAIRDLRALLKSPAHRRWASVATTVALSAAALAVANLVIRRTGDTARDAYDAGVPLNLPGSSKIRLIPDQVRPFRQVTEVLVRRCSTFLSLPGLNSFYFWARETPPTGENATAWMTLFDDDTQREIVAESSPRRSLCVLKNDAIAEVWLNGEPLAGKPLVRFMRREFRPVYRNAGYVVLVRRSEVPG